jgi:hypothetical protein
LKFIERTIDRSFELIGKYADSNKISEKSLVKNVISDILKSLNGIDNLKITYDNDNKFLCDLKVIRQSIIPRLKDIESKRPELFEEEQEENELLCRKKENNNEENNES